MATLAAPRQILVTGCYRSGTTLLEKLLHGHPQICVGAQAFPTLFHHSMELLHRSLGITRRYPMGHLFCEPAYGLTEVEAFLDALTLGDEDLDRIFETLDLENESFDSVRLASRRAQIRPGSFLSVLAQLSTCIAELHGATEAEWLGTKEILCEAHLPFLIHRGHAGVLIVRDPRDVVASTHFRSRGQYTGDQRPVLSTIRIWRKSVAVLLELSGQPHFSWLRYEDLISDPSAVLESVTTELGITPYPAALLAEPIRDQAGHVWRSNSSFEMGDGIQASSVSSFEQRVPKSVTAYVETLCRPEMLRLGYAPRFAHGFDPKLVAGYRDPFDSFHERFEANYSSDPRRVGAEIQRWQTLVRERGLSASIREQFLSTTAYEALRSALTEDDLGS